MHLVKKFLQWIKFCMFTFIILASVILPSLISVYFLMILIKSSLLSKEGGKFRIHSLTGLTNILRFCKICFLYLSSYLQKSKVKFCGFLNAFLPTLTLFSRSDFETPWADKVPSRIRPSRAKYRLRESLGSFFFFSCVKVSEIFTLV